MNALGLRLKPAKPPEITSISGGLRPKYR
jgi:hypothetical protein